MRSLPVISPLTQHRTGPVQYSTVSLIEYYSRVPGVSDEPFSDLGVARLGVFGRGAGQYSTVQTVQYQVLQYSTVQYLGLRSLFP